MDELTFCYGFTYEKVRYGWKEKKLFRLPFTKNKRSYGLKEINPLLIGSTKVYNVQKNKITINRLRDITTPVNWSVSYFKNSDCPF